MLNISHNKVYKYVRKGNYSTLVNVEAKTTSKVLRRILLSLFIVVIITSFLPWTQTIRSEGFVTTLKPEHRPQRLNSVIGGQVETWFVQEGDFVSKGDTILKIKEIKDAYFDDKLLARTKNQVNLKKQSVTNYSDKIAVIDNQIAVLKEQRDLKLSQAKNKLQQAILKVQNDSITATAEATNYDIAQQQFSRIDSLYQQGLKSKYDYEQRKLKLQQTQAYALSARNKWYNAQNEVTNLSIELSNIEVKFQSDLNKLQSDRITALTQQYEAEGSVNKLENTYSNYEFRNGLYFITAPQNGYVTKTATYGIGEIIKEGQEILSFMPMDYELALELYVEPIDLPLIQVSEEVRIQFDGWPAIIFSGWPNASHGTYSGKIYAIDQFISANGKYRVLVKQDPEQIPWPDALRVGSGATNLIMLGDVPVWYELWRNVNGFPPEYYKAKEQQDKKTKK
ncbi:Multidrug resistance efflux pump [Lishizhenia tianjinensis]|uniref:Multidrug resistance efflux pump n=1 Tax=Lishizhenia tianjinensis TaxID=477690 RepID=A0A1I7AI49_9FLAO|nr:biotin/lipoyl-binding protein [Lishizhenia tianjinensis]SFT74629.1 Multidrug resistance efflux pump [Lishizhenia tianjinensis]